MRTESRELLAVGIFGNKSRLGDRIELLMRRGRTFSPHASASGVAASAVVLTVLLLAGSLAPRWVAFAQQPARPSFEVASLKPGDSFDQRVGIHLLPGGRFVTTNATLKILLAFAYDVPTHQIFGGPKWLDSENFNIEALTGTTEATPPGSDIQTRQMLQSLLAERFKLFLHMEIKQEPVYELTIADGGPKLKEVSGEIKSPAVRLGRAQLTGTGVTVSTIARSLSQRLGRSVIDKTGLTGRYDFDLTYTPDAVQTAAPGTQGPDTPSSDPNGPTIFTAIQEQLGLRLQSAKGSAEVLVIDHVEKPDAN